LNPNGRCAGSGWTRTRYLAARRGIPPSEYLSALLQPLIEREFKKADRELMDEGGEK
jgi:hypothetical protein